MKTSFRNDYGRFAHPQILDAIARYGKELNDPYGLDRHSEAAAEEIKRTFGCPDASVYFLMGGTSANLAFLSYALRPYEAVLCCDSAHINVHETGAIEGSGHKVLTVQGIDGKPTIAALEKALRAHTDEHMVLPRALYISNATETGTIYKKIELLKLWDFCKENGLYFYIDGARLGAALTARHNDVLLEELGSLCDAFYVGGGKNGLGIGEAVVLVNPELQHHFRYHIKNRGAMLAKGYLLGIEFEEGFRNGLYFELARHANEMAEEVDRVLRKYHYEPEPFESNQLFCTFPHPLATALIEEFGCEKWSVQDNATTIRFVTSYATSFEDIAALDSFLRTR